MTPINYESMLMKLLGMGFAVLRSRNSEEVAKLVDNEHNCIVLCPSMVGMNVDKIIRRITVINPKPVVISYHKP